MQVSTSNSIGLNVGPSGRAIAQPMDVDLLEALYQHTSLERVSSAQYLAMSLWFLERELRGFSSFFKKESLSEQEHGFNFAKYMIARGQTVELEEVTKPIQEWKTVQDLVTLSFQMEADVTTSVQQLYSMAERSNDTRSTVFLDPVIDEQIKSEDEMRKVFNLGIGYCVVVPSEIEEDTKKIIRGSDIECWTIGTTK